MAKRASTRARARPRRAERLRSSIPGLDVALCGGLLARRAYLVKGAPGTGKTVLAAQYCFDLARSGASSAFVTLLSESHGTLLDNMRSLSFFDEDLVGEKVHVISGYDALVEGGLRGLAELVQGAIRQYGASLVVLDSIAAALEQSESPLRMKQFLRELATYGSLLGCTTLLVATDVRPDQVFMETVADGVIELSRTCVAMRSLRTLEVLKSRGSAHLKGKHVFVISEHGLCVHPRTEARVGERVAVAPAKQRRVPFGVKKLDEMLGGGLVAGSSTAVMGAPGAGKTLLGLQFLDEGARRGEQGLYYGFFEAPPRVISKAEGIGLGLERHVRRGLVELLWRPPLEYPIDAMAEQIFEAVQRRGVRRLFIDGIDGFRTCADFPDRLPRFFAALTNELRALGVTTLMSEETDPFAQSGQERPTDLSALFENLLSLRFVESQSRLRRQFSILKVRDSDYDGSLRELWVTSRGIQLGESPPPPGRRS